MKLVIILSCLLCLFSSMETSMRSNLNKRENNEYEVKAAFIYNFTKYIEWDAEKLKESTNFKIHVFNNSPVENYLKESLKDKKINGKKIELTRIESCEDIEEANVFFIPYHISTKEFKNCVSKLDTKNTLIISEKEGRITNGSCINFLVIANKIKFEINLSNLKKNNLKASSQLLKLAERIEK